MDVVMIRHTSVDVPQGVCYGFTDVPLKDTFETEAETVKRQLDNHKFDAVYASPLSRCVKLAAYCGYPDAQRDDRLKEINMGDWEMQPFDAIADPRIKEWYDDYLHVPATNGESYEDIYRRVSSFLDELKTKRPNYGKVAIFAHGGVLVCAQVYVGAVKPENAFQELTPYGGLIKITI